MAEEVAKDEDYSIEDWEKIWKSYDNNKPRKVTEELKKYLDVLLPVNRMSVFLPLCGQTPDLRWLYDKGHTVVGVDGVEIAIKRIVSRNKDLKFKKEAIEDEEGAVKYVSEDGRFTLVVSDILEPHIRRLGPFDACFDYGAYTAIKPSDRKKYLYNVMATMKPESYRYIVEFCHDVSPEVEDHPCVISFQTMKKEMGPAKLKVLETNDCSDMWAAQSFFSSFVLVTPK